MISVCMATYNGEKYIKEQLDSILSQLCEDDEIIISDDSSTDRTVEIIRSYYDNRIRLFANQNFKSPIYNFENTLKKAQGDIIILADQDDVWMNNKVKIIKKYMQDYDLVLSDAYIINEYGDVIEESFYKLNGSRNGLIKNIVKNSYLGCTMAFNKKILEKSLPFPNDLPMHDWWIGLIGEMYGNIYFIKDKLVMYRRHSANVSLTGEKSKYSLFKKISFRLIMVKNLFLRYIGILV